MTVDAIKEEISNLSEEERKLLLDWLEELEEQVWDEQIERDFAPGGRGAHVVERIDCEIDRAISRGNVTSLEEGLRTRRERRSRK
jgi:hypothetical protein